MCDHGQWVDDARKQQETEVIHERFYRIRTGCSLRQCVVIKSTMSFVNKMFKTEVSPNLYQDNQNVIKLIGDAMNETNHYKISV